MILKPKHDPLATGPQDWTEYNAARLAAMAAPQPTKKARKAAAA